MMDRRGMTFQAWKRIKAGGVRRGDYVVVRPNAPDIVVVSHIPTDGELKWIAQERDSLIPLCGEVSASDSLDALDDYCEHCPNAARSSHKRPGLAQVLQA